MLELWLDNWWIRVCVVTAGLCIITYPQWWPRVTRKLESAREKDRIFAKLLHKLLNEIERQIENWDASVSAKHPFADIMRGGSDNGFADLHSELVHILETKAETLNMQDPGKFKKIEVPFRRYTHPWRPEEDCRGIEFFKKTEELKRYGRIASMEVPLFRDPPEEVCGPSVLKSRLVKLMAKINDEFGNLLRAYPAD